jgi:hypothetical protein
MTKNSPHFSLDHPRLLDALVASDKLLIIQDLDGVCMGLVRDPLTRTIEQRYVQPRPASKASTCRDWLPAACNCRTATARSATRA